MDGVGLLGVRILEIWSTGGPRTLKGGSFAAEGPWAHTGVQTATESWWESGRMKSGRNWIQVLEERVTGFIK